MYSNVMRFSYIYIFQSDSPGATLNLLSMFILISLFFVMGTTMELAIVLIVKRTKSRFRLKTNNPRTKRHSVAFSRDTKGSTVIIGNESENQELHRFQNHESTAIQNYDSRKQFTITETTNKIDFSAFCLFLSAYVIFICIYFVKYM